MTKKELYTCDICHTDYAKKEDALKCENGHKMAKFITDYECVAHSDYPYKILVTFDNGESEWYRR